MARVSSKPTVVVSRSEAYTDKSINDAFLHLCDNLVPSLPSLIKPRDKVFIKINLGCTGIHKFSDRMTTHPLFLKALILALKDCGAIVAIGDDCPVNANLLKVWEASGVLDLARHTGVELVDYFRYGADEVKGSLEFPKSYLISRAVLDSDIVINAANGRSHPTLVFSGAIKNIFGSIVGNRKGALHGLFPHVKEFSKILVDIFQTVAPVFSFLDLTTVVGGLGIKRSVHSVGLMIGGQDAIAIDTLAVSSIGYSKLDNYVLKYGAQIGIGVNNIKNINIKGLDWDGLDKKQLPYPYIAEKLKENLYDKFSRRLNLTTLRPRPVIDSRDCISCRNCFLICPKNAVIQKKCGAYSIQLERCSDCYCCIKVCENNAIKLEFLGSARVIRNCMSLMSLSGKKFKTA